MPTHQNAPKSDRRRNTEWDRRVSVPCWHATPVKDISTENSHWGLHNPTFTISEENWKYSYMTEYRVV